MKAIMYNQYGPPEVLHLAEIPRPEPKESQVRIAVKATTVTAGDWRMRKPDPQAARLFNGLFKPKRVKVLGFEVAGVVDAVGKNVTRFHTGDQVYAYTGLGFGGYAEYICLPEDGDEKKGLVAPKPENLSFEEAAAVPTGALAALNILRKGGIRGGQDVLIIGASGSVGTYALQLARHFGTSVDGVTSSGNMELARSLGAEHVYDYSVDDYLASGKKYDLVFDAAGRLLSGLTKNDVKKTLTPAGVFVSVEMSRKDTVQDLFDLKDIIECGKVRPVIDQVFSLEQIVQAHHHVEGGHKKGNVVVKVS